MIKLSIYSVKNKIITMKFSNYAANSLILVSMASFQQIRKTVNARNIRKTITINNWGKGGRGKFFLDLKCQFASILSNFSDANKAVLV